MFSWILTFLMIPTQPLASHAVAHPVSDAEIYKVIDQPVVKTVEVWTHDQNAALDDDEIDPEALVAGEWSEDGIRPDWGQLIDSDTQELKSAQAVLPLNGGTLSLKFHDSKHTQHDGIDIHVPNRTAVKAAWAGQVQFAQCTDGRGGCTVMIRHANGLSTYYSQLSGRPWVRRGDMVAQGQTLGQAGPLDHHNSAGTSASHLHFEVRSGRRAVNPLLYVHY